jgi:hypothetical protein
MLSPPPRVLLSSLCLLSLLHTLQVAQCPKLFANEAEKVLAAIEPLFKDKAPTVVDNACGAVARVASAVPHRLPLGHVAAALVRLLPLRSDYEEAEPVYTCIIGMLLGPHMEQVAGQRSALVHALVEGALHEKVPEPVRAVAAHGVREALARWGDLETAALCGLSDVQKTELLRLAAAG